MGYAGFLADWAFSSGICALYAVTVYYNIYGTDAMKFNQPIHSLDVSDNYEPFGGMSGFQGYMCSYCMRPVSYPICTWLGPLPWLVTWFMKLVAFVIQITIMSVAPILAF